MLSNIIRFFDKSFTDQDSVITAIRSNKINQLKSLLEKKADVDAKNREGVRPLQAAFDSRNITIFKVLIEYKADINFQYGRYSRTLLDIALDHDCRSYAQLLLEKQASVDIKNEHGRIPLHYAAQNGYINEVELLIETANLDYRDKKDDTALHLALRNNRPKVAVLLINKKGTSINLADGEGLFPLHKAVQKGDDNIVNLLLDKKADIEALTTTTTPRTSLMLAAEQDKSPMIKLLIQSKANTEFKNKDGKNAILYAAEKNHLDSVKTLLEWNAAIPGDEITKLKDNNCKTYLQLLQNGLEFSERVGILNKKGYLTLSFLINHDDLNYYGSKPKPLPFSEGAYGNVYRGTYKFNSVAIKRFKSVYFTQEYEEQLFIQKFLIEASIMARVSLFSDYLVKSEGICLKPHYCLVMEYVPGGNLHELLKKRSLSDLTWPVKYRIAQGIAIGLYHLHEADIIHGDLKSLNVLLKNFYRLNQETDYQVKLCDFGLSKMKEVIMTEKDQSSNQSPGTIQWMAPELLNGTGKFSKASDIFALGMIILELATHQIPYEKIRKKIIEEADSDIFPSIRKKLKSQLIKNLGKELWEKSEYINNIDEIKETKKTVLQINDDNDSDTDDDVSREFSNFLNTNYKLSDPNNTKGRLVLRAFWEVVRDNQQDKIKEILEGKEDIFTNQALAIPTETPSAIKEIIRNCCILNVKDRVITAKEVAERLKKLCDEEKKMKLKEMIESKIASSAKLKSSISDNMTQTLIGSLRKSSSSPNINTLYLLRSRS